MYIQSRTTSCPIKIFAIVYLFLGKYVYGCEQYSLSNATLKKANYSSGGCSATFNAEVVHTFDENNVCFNIEVGAETVYFSKEQRYSRLVTFDMEGF